MTGVIGGGVLACGVLTALAVADVPMAFVAVAAFGMLGLAGLWTRLRGRLRFRLLPPWEWQPAIAQIRGEARAARPQWTKAELAALDDEASLEQLLGRLPEARRERRLR